MRPVPTQRLWHVSEDADLCAGAVVPRGRWGRLVRQHGARHPWAAREAAFEEHRRERTDVPVSRLDCVFCWPTARDAVAWAGSAKGPRNVYEVTASPGSALCGVDPTWLRWWTGASGDRSTRTRCARGYWAGTGVMGSWTPTWEVLVGGDVVVTVRAGVTNENCF